MAFTEFCCRSGGSNMNGGGLASNAEPATSAVYSATNGGWNSGTGVFTPTSGNPSLSVTVGDFASVFNDGATTPVFIGRVTGVNSTTVTVSTSVISGTAPTTSATARSINVGGAWKGPNAAVGFPISVMDGNTVNSAIDTMRINYKNDQTYNITANITNPNSHPVYHRGYTTSFGDGGKATLSDNLAGTSYALLSLNSDTGTGVEDFIFDGNGASGAAAGVLCFRAGLFRHCIFRNMRGNGLYMQFGNGLQSTVVECEAYGNNTSNSASLSGFYNEVVAVYIRCISHDNSTGNSNGFLNAGSATYIDCISCNNGNTGFPVGTGNSTLINCDSYNNGGSGADSSGTGMTYAENSNLVKNGGYGISVFAAVQRIGYVVNCGFGSGTQANTSGQIQSTYSSSNQIGTITYASGVTPWNAPTTGDFSITLAAAKNTGQGGFLETTGSPGTFTGTIGYPDIGAAQHLDAGGSTGPIGQLKEFARGTPF